MRRRARDGGQGWGGEARARGWWLTERVKTNVWSKRGFKSQFMIFMIFILCFHFPLEAICCIPRGTNRRITGRCLRSLPFARCISGPASGECSCSEARSERGLHRGQTHLPVRCQVQRQLATRVPLVHLGAGLQERDGRVRVALGHGVVQRRLAVAVGGVQRALVLQEQADHGHGAHGGGAVEGVLAAPVADPGRRRGGVVEETPGDVEVVLGGDEVDDRLARVV